MSVKTTHLLDVEIPKVAGVSVFAAMSFGGTHNHVTASSTVSAATVAPGRTTMRSTRAGAAAEIQWTSSGTRAPVA